MDCTYQRSLILAFANTAKLQSSSRDKNPPILDPWESCHLFSSGLPDILMDIPWKSPAKNRIRIQKKWRVLTALDWFGWENFKRKVVPAIFHGTKKPSGDDDVSSFPSTIHWGQRLPILLAGPRSTMHRNLVGGFSSPRPEKYEFVNWDDEQPNFFIKQLSELVPGMLKRGYTGNGW